MGPGGIPLEARGVREVAGLAARPLPVPGFSRIANGLGVTAFAGNGNGVGFARLAGAIADESELSMFVVKDAATPPASALELSVDKALGGVDAIATSLRLITCL